MSCSECVCGRGSAPEPAGELRVLPQTLAGGRGSSLLPREDPYPICRPSATMFGTLALRDPCEWVCQLHTDKISVPQDKFGSTPLSHHYLHPLQQRTKIFEQKAFSAHERCQSIAATAACWNVWYLSIRKSTSMKPFTVTFFVHKTNVAASRKPGLWRLNILAQQSFTITFL